MVSLGQWIISTPRLRNSATTSFMRGAISATRAVAPLHQCLSHMSQITTAVAEDCQEARLVTCCHWPEEASVGTMRRRLRDRVSARADKLPESSAIATQIRKKGRWIGGVIVRAVTVSWRGLQIEN